MMYPNLHVTNNIGQKVSINAWYVREQLTVYSLTHVCQKLCKVCAMKRSIVDVWRKQRKLR